MLVTYKSTEIENVWLQVVPLITRIIDKIDVSFTLEEIKTSLQKQEMQLWTLQHERQITSICLTQIVKQSDKTYLDIFGLAGDMEVLSYLCNVEEWAKSMNCESVKITGRKGWSKVLKDYTIDKIILKKAL